MQLLHGIPNTGCLCWELTCSTNDCNGHDCGASGACYDLSVAGQRPAGEFSCPCHEVCMLSNDSDGDTCSRISCASFSVNNSNQCPSVELLMDDTVLVQCDDGLSLDGTPEGSSFTVTCLKVWRTCWRRNLCQDCLSGSPFGQC